MDGTYRTGDLILVRHQTSYHVGDIVAYTIPANEFGAGAHVIHRIVGGNATVGYTTQGDNKTITDPWHPRPRDVLGRSRLRVPGGGNVIQYLARPLPLGLLCGGITVLALLSASRNESKTHLASDHDPGLSAASAT
jgi:signal peptidase